MWSLSQKCSEADLVMINLYYLHFFFLCKKIDGYLSMDESLKLFFLLGLLFCVYIPE